MVKGSSRIQSLDIFRGMTVAFMIIVNTPGSWKYVYSPLRHSEWHGCTPTDLVFPFFLFIVGVSMWFSFKKYGHELNSASFFRIIRRAVTIFTLGVFLNIFPYFERDYSTLRIMGVLQRIALAYLIASLVCLSVRKEYLWIIFALILLGYWALLGIFGGGDPYSTGNNLVLKIDKAILGQSHLYRGYGIPFDPEGLLSTLPSACTVILGYYTGELIGKNSTDLKTVLKILAIGISLSGLGLLWNILLPINKPLWTSSFVLYTGGIAMTAFALIYLLAEVWKLRKWGFFFIVFGTNALFSYFIAGIWTRLLMAVKVMSGTDKISLYTWFYEKICAPVAGNLNGSLMFAIIQMILVWTLALILYRKKIMIRL
ncbi:MAG: hypothetical protein HPY62_12755 [Bacteroidales bacterium]|nr:hypothetical protein [Bacteroidales bacterium]